MTTTGAHDLSAGGDVMERVRGCARRALREYDCHPDSAIVPVHIGDDWKTVLLWRALLDQGVYTNCAVAPAVR